jgi:sec-independent protein translocase protein TatA
MEILAAIMGLGPGELVLIFAILLLLFGATKLPNLARGLGQSIKEFKKASTVEEEPTKVADAKKPVETGKTTGTN